MDDFEFEIIPGEYEDFLLELETEAFKKSDYYEFLTKTYYFLFGLERSAESLEKTLIIFFGDISEEYDIPFDFEEYLKDQCKIYSHYVERLEYEYTNIQHSTEKRSFIKRMVDTITDCWVTLLHELNRYQAYNSKKITLNPKLSKAQSRDIKLSAQEQFHLLKEIGFLQLDFVQKLNDKQLKYLISLIIPKDSRTIEGIINSEKPESLEMKYSVTQKHKDKVAKIIDTIKEIQ